MKGIQININQFVWGPTVHFTVVNLNHELTLTSENKRNAIKRKFLETGEDTLVLRSDKLIRRFFRYFDDRWNNLDDFIQDGQKYGELQKVKIEIKCFAACSPSANRSTWKIFSEMV